MWVPESAAELERALAEGGLEETASFEGKREPGKNEDIVVDICAMTPGGGAIVYGTGENADKTRLTEPHPFVLSGQRERVSQLAQTGISEPPTIDVRALERDGSPGEGYLVVVGPAVRAGAPPSHPEGQASGPLRRPRPDREPHPHRDRGGAALRAAGALGAGFARRGGRGLP